MLLPHRSVIFPVVLFFVFPLSASAFVDSSTAAHYRNMSVFFLEQNCPDSSLRHQILAFSAFRERDEPAHWLQTHLLLAQARRKEGDHVEAERILLHALGDSLWRMPRDSAEWNALGLTYAGLAHAQSALPLREAQVLLAYEKSKEILRDQLGRRDVWVGMHVLRPLAGIYARQGNTPAAVELLGAFRADAMASRDFKAAALADADLAALWMQRGKIPAAIELLRKSLQLPRLDPESLGAVHGSLQKAYLLRDNPGSALIHGRLAAQFYRRCGRECAWRLAVVLAENGVIQAERGNLRDARKLLEESRATAKTEFRGEYPPELAPIYLRFGKLYHAWGEYEESLRWYQRALMAALPGFQEKDYRIHPPASLIGAENVVMEALYGKARAFEALYRKSRRREQLDHALVSFELSFHAERRLRSLFPKDFSALPAEAEGRERLQRAIEVALELAQTGSETQYQERAFAVAEQHRNMLITEAFAQTGIAAPARMISLHPDSAAATVAAIQNGLPGKDRAYLAYSIGKDRLFAFVISKTRFVVLNLPLDFPLEDWVVQLRRNLEMFQQANADRSKLCESYGALAQQLYQKLIQPLEQTGALQERLTILPSGILCALPFEALLSAKPQTLCDYRTYPFLLRKYRISYGFSATLQMELARQPRRVKSGYLGVGPVLDGRDGMPVLRHNLSLLESAHDLLGGRLLLRDQATAANFKQKATRFGVLHLATQAQAQPPGNDTSFLWLADGQGGYDPLAAQGIYPLRLNADLVLLQSCDRTDLRSEANIPLFLGFMYAGAGCVVAPLWNDDNETAGSLLLDFLRGIQSGKSKRDALWEAKIRQIDTSTDTAAAHPAFWAAYTAWGDMGTRDRGVSRPVLLWALALLALVGTVVYGLRRGKSR